MEKKDTKIWFPEEYITSEVPFPVLDNRKLSLLLPPSYISKKALPLSNWNKTGIGYTSIIASAWLYQPTSNFSRCIEIVVVMDDDVITQLQLVVGNSGDVK